MRASDSCYDRVSMCSGVYYRDSASQFGMAECRCLTNADVPQTVYDDNAVGALYELKCRVVDAGR